MNDYTLLTLESDRRGVASVTLNRPEVHNAFDDRLIGELTQVFAQLDADKAVRIAVLSGSGKSFCAGGDIHWMKKMKGFSQQENIADGARLAAMFARIRHFSKPLIGVVHGFALGGGSGLASVCDYVIAAEDAKFGFTESKLGLVPATIAPFVMEKIGISAARAYFLSGAIFSAATARDMGLVHKLASREMLAVERDEAINEFLKAGPEASRRAKALIGEVARLYAASGSVTDKALTDYTVSTIATVRIGAEAQEGMSALLENRKPAWASA
jgi:methylglutaconyl-CoA hydratase